MQLLSPIVLDYLYWVSLCAVCIYAFVFGGRTERLGALLMIVATAATMALMIFRVPLRATQAETLATAVFVVDLALLVGFVLLSIGTTKFWPLWAAGFHLASIFTHLADMIDPTLLPRAYILFQPFWAYPMFLALAVGTRRHQVARTPA